MQLKLLKWLADETKEKKEKNPVTGLLPSDDVNTLEDVSIHILNRL